MEQNFKISLKAARVNAGLTLDQVSKALRISKATLIQYEKGRSYPTVQTVRNMCDLYNISVDHVSILA